MDSLSHREREYNISRNNRICMIINNVNFRSMERRLGSHEDAINIKKTFEPLGFEVYRHIDCTCEQMRYHLSNLRNGQNNISCLFIVFLSHGDKDGIYGVMEEHITFTEIQSCLVTHLRHLESAIPITLFFQSCRDGEKQSKDIIKYPKPISDHFLLVFATQPHCKAYRDDEEGSLFIQCLLTAIKEEPQETNMLNILTCTNRLLSESEWNKQTNQRLQFNSLLLRNLHLPRRQQQNDQLTLSGSQEDQISFSDSDISTLTQEEHKVAIKPGVPSINLHCGLSITFNNTSHHDQGVQDKLKEKMEEQGYCVLSFNNIDWSSMKILLKMASKVACKTFMLFVLSEGERELVYDVNKKPIPKRRIIDFFMAADSPMRDTCKFFYFQTTISEPKVETQRHNRESPLLPCNSICYQISSESSLIPRFLRNIQRFQEEIKELIPLRDMLAHSIGEGKKSGWNADENKTPPPVEVIQSLGRSNPENYDTHLTIQCSREDILLGYLMLVPQIKLTINQKLKSIYTKETNSGTEQDTFSCLFFLHEYDDITRQSDQDLIGARSICLLEEELHSITETIIKSFPITEVLQHELHTYKMCSRWTLTTFFESMTQTQCIDPKKLMDVHNKYVDFSLDVVKTIKTELEKTKDKSPRIDQPLEEQNE